MLPFLYACRHRQYRFQSLEGQGINSHIVMRFCRWSWKDSLGRVFSPATEEAWAAAFCNYSVGMFPTFEAMNEAA